MPTEPAESPADDEAGETSLDEYADIAFDALKNDDRAAFVEAFKGALRCGPE